MDKVKLTAITRKILVVYASYLVLSLVLILPALNIALTHIYNQFTGRQLDYDLVGFNPFSLSIFAYGLRDTNPDGSTLWAMDALVINPSIMHSLWRGAIGIDDIQLLGLTLLPEKVDQQLFNFSDIVQHLEKRKTPTTANQAASQASFMLPRVWIGEFRLKATLLQYTESQREKKFRAGLRDFHFDLRDFSTLNEQGDGYHLRAESAQGGVVEWQGDISASGAKTWGRFRLSNFKLLPIWQFMEPDLNFILKDGSFSIAGEYEVSWRDQLQWQIANTYASVDNLTMEQTSISTLPSQQPSLVQWKTLSAQLAKASSAEKKVSIQAVTLNELKISSWHNESRLGLTDMFSMQVTAMPELRIETEKNPTSIAETDDSEPKWSLVIDSTALNNASLSWLVPELDNRLVTIAPLNIDVKNFSNSDNAARVNANLQIDNVANISLSGTTQPQSMSAQLKTTITNLPLSWANPILSKHINASLKSGVLSSEFDLAIEHAKPNKISAQLSIDDFDLIDKKQASIASIKKLAVDAIDVSLQARSLIVNRINIDELKTEITIGADGTTNFNTLVKDQSQSNQHNGLSTEDASTSYSWVVNDVSLNQAAIAFTDETPISTFNTQIESFNGKILNINSNPEQALNINLKGHVDGYAPVTLKGTAKPFLIEPAMDLALDFKSIDLGLFNPYSTTFTGWKIEKGLLNVNLNYQLQDKRIIGQNRVILDQLTLGERIDSRRLIDLPVRFALALLTDEHGIIDLQVPVKGTTDTPSFSIGSIIWSAVRNSIMKIVTAPFSLLASLVDSEEDLGQVVFDTQQVTLNESANSTLANLKLALEQRPQLRLGITGDVDIAQEARPFKQQTLNKKLLERGLSQTDIDSGNERWRSNAIELLINNDNQDTDTLTDTQLLGLLVEQQPLPSAALQELAEARAAAVKQHLLIDLALDPERVFVQSSSLKCEEENHCSQARASFSIE